MGEMDTNEAPRSKLRGIKAELRRSQPAFALKSFGAVRHAIHPCSKLQGILAKANKIPGERYEEIWINCHMSRVDPFFAMWVYGNVICRTDVANIDCKPAPSVLLP